MFPEYRALISKLKVSDAHFENLFNKHNELDQKIHKLESGVLTGTATEIENLKKEKLHLKDQLFSILSKAASAAG